MFSHAGDILNIILDVTRNMQFQHTNHTTSSPGLHEAEHFP